MIRKPKKVETQTATDTNPAELRIKKDIQNLLERQEKYKEVANAKLEFPKQGSVLEFEIVIRPRSESLYRNSQITFEVTVPNQYSIQPPVVKCKNRVFHPNIDENRCVCLSILRQGWMANYELIQIVYGLSQILESLSLQDIEKPLDAMAADLMKKDIQQYEKVVQSTLKGNSFQGRKFDNVMIK